MKKNQGITLVALVITVILMLILAGTTISVLTADGGMVSRTKNSADIYKEQSIIENAIVGNLMSYIDEQVKLNGDTFLLSEKARVGEYVDYDAGNWETATTGITAGQSRNTNASSSVMTDGLESSYTGWRVWDVDENGCVVLVSAGAPEAYSHAKGTYNPLITRDCSMYLNELANNAQILSGTEITRWYNKYFDKNFSFQYGSEFADIDDEEALKNMIVIGSTYYAAVIANSASMYYVGNTGFVSYTYTGDGQTRRFGIRVLITLKEGVRIDKNHGDGSAENPWRLVME